jgi:anti-sigma-K factor RskA
VNSNDKLHLNENQLIQAVVDAADLPAAAQAHLAACNQCRTSKQNFEQELTNLGRIARQSVPKPQRRIVLPVPKPAGRWASFWNWRSITAAAAIAAAAVVVVWGANIARNFSERQTENLTAEMRDAKRLMTEVNSLVDNALPPFYLEISNEPDSDYDEEFYKFLIPPIENNNVTSEQEKRGTSLC